MKRTAIILAGLVVLLAGCAAGASSGSYRQIPMSEAAVLLETERDYILLDVRTHAEYDQGHIPGAICVPNETIGAEDVAELPDKERLIFVYCRSGNRSKQAAGKLVKLGYTNIVEIGGINSWTGQIVTE